MDAPTGSKWSWSVSFGPRNAIQTITALFAQPESPKRVADQLLRAGNEEPKDACLSVGGLKREPTNGMSLSPGKPLNGVTVISSLSPHPQTGNSMVQGGRRELESEQGTNFSPHFCNSKFDRYEPEQLDDCDHSGCICAHLPVHFPAFFLPRF